MLLMILIQGCYQYFNYPTIFRLSLPLEKMCKFLILRKGYFFRAQGHPPPSRAKLLIQPHLLVLLLGYSLPTGLPQMEGVSIDL